MEIMSKLQYLESMIVISFGLIVLSVALSLMFSGCTFAEINIVQRATISNGDGTESMQHDSIAKEEEDSMKLIVPIK